ENSPRHTPHLRTDEPFAVTNNEWIILHEGLDMAQVFQRVYCMSVHVGLNQPHPKAMLDHTQHIDRFCPLQRRRRYPSELAQEVTAEGNYAYLLEYWRRLAR